jgi:hypothetical protein
MKKLSFICLVSLCATTLTNAQMRDTTLNMNMHKVDANSLFQKSIRQKTAAWLLLGGGAGITIVGLAIMPPMNFEWTLGGVGTAPVEHKHSTAGPILAIAGTGAMLGSIPLFITSAKNKRKANLMLINENVFFNPRLNIKEHIVAIGIKINL